MKTQLIPITHLDAPSDWHRSPSKVDDDALRRSIEEGGIQQPLVVLADGKRFLIVDGIRRMKVAGILGIAKVPAVVDEVPRGENAEAYARKIRFILDELRQDLTPSQRAELIERLKQQFNMTNLAVSQYLGVDQDSITNWLAIRRYIPEVVQALDRGKLTMQAARAFDGMTEFGQKRVWKADGEQLCVSAGGRMHKEIRAKYPPTKFREYYREPDKIAARLKPKDRKTRKRVARPSFTPAEKQRLLTSFEFKDAQLKDAEADLKQFKAEIAAAAPIVSAIMRNDKLRNLVPADMLPELERFAEIY